MQVSSRITIDTVAVNNLCGLAKDALVQTAEALHTEVVQAEVMPRDMGTLQNESTFVDTSGRDFGRVSIVSSTPYARRLYFHPEYNFHRGEWFDEYGDSHGGNIAAGGKSAFLLIVELKGLYDLVLFVVQYKRVIFILH